MVATASPSLQTAFEYHRAGDLGSADAICRDVLRVDPRHAEALHLMGVIAFQRRENVAAVDCIGQAIDVDGTRPEYHNSLGNVYRTLNRPIEAMEAFREALRLKPDFSIAYNNLGIVLAECGHDRGAIASFERAVQLDQRNVQAWTNLGSALLALGVVEDATACFECAIAVNPNHGPAYAPLARCRVRAGRFDEAVIAFERALQHTGETAPLLKDLAASYLRTGRTADAEGAYRRALERSPKDPVLLLNLAQSLKDQKKLAEAVGWYQRGLTFDPQNGAAHYAYARALHQLERFADAIAAYRNCLALGSRDPKTAYHLGNACKSLKRLSEAVEAYRKALEWDPDFIPALYQLGNAYRQSNDLDEARRCFERVLKRQPNDLQTLLSLGNTLREQDDLPGASAAFKQVIARVSNEPSWELWRATLCPMVFHSNVGIDQYREKLLAELQFFADENLSISATDIANRGCPPPYNLQFHGRDDRPLKEAYAGIFRNCQGGKAEDSFDPRRSGDKPRVGFVVSDAHELVFLRYFRGVLERFDREAFDPVIICSAAGEVRMRAELPAETIETFVIPSRFDQIVDRVRAGRFDVLYHWEVGSDTTNYYLPFFQLAPVQCTGAGLPETSGISQIDYFLSNDVCEPGRAEHDYTERLIRSRSLLTWQRRIQAADGSCTRADFGIAADEHFYLCPHKIQKFHPDFDDLLGEILRYDPRGVVVIPEDRHGHAARKLGHRLRLALPHVANRIRFVPYQSTDSYFGLVRAADVLLDPIHYGGGLTSLDGFSFNKPIVTLPGRFLRGRYTLGFYRTMGVADCIAANEEEYVKIAVRLGTDRDWRMHVVELIREKSDVLFEADDAVTEYQRIFVQLIEEAQHK